MNFNELKVNPLILEGIEKMGFELMTDIQAKVIPLALKGCDVIGQAQREQERQLHLQFLY